MIPGSIISIDIYRFLLEGEVTYEKQNTAAEKTSSALNKESAVATTYTVSGVVATSVLTSIVAGTGTSILMSLIKFFQIVDIIGNLSKINIKFGSIVDQVLEYCNNIKLPEFTTTASISPV